MCSDALKDIKNRKTSVYTEALMSKYSSDLDGVTLCAQSDLARSFVKRPDQETSECPTDYEPCSIFTSPANTYCVKLADKSNCPITDVKLVESQSIASYLVKDVEKPAYEEAPIDNFDESLLNWRLIYSREYDSPPIVEFQLE